MEYRTLGRTGVQVSSLCMGCLNFGKNTEPHDSYDIIDRALESRRQSLGHSQCLQSWAQ